MAARAFTAQTRGVVKLSSIPAWRKTVRAPFRKGLGPAPLAARNRHQRSFAQRDREIIGRAGLLSDTDRILQGRVAAIKITAKDARDPLCERGYGCHEALRREPTHGLVGVGAHLLGTAPAQDGPEQGGPRLGRRVIGPGRVPVLPAVDHIGPPLGLYRPRLQRGQERGQHRGHRVSLDPAPVLQPQQPPRTVVTRPCRWVGTASFPPGQQPY